MVDGFIQAVDGYVDWVMHYRRVHAARPAGWPTEKSEVVEEYTSQFKEAAVNFGGFQRDIARIGPELVSALEDAKIDSTPVLKIVNAAAMKHGAYAAVIAIWPEIKPQLQRIGMRLAPAGGTPEEPPPVVNANDDRDKWIYEQGANATKTWRKISAALTIKAQARGWELILTGRGCLAAANRYATRHKLDKLPARQRGRLKDKKK